jgi:hypothetical protein
MPSLYSPLILVGGCTAAGTRQAETGYWVCFDRFCTHPLEANPRRMVVPAITDIDMDTFDERKDSSVNAKCYPVIFIVGASAQW